MMVFLLLVLNFRTIKPQPMSNQIQRIFTLTLIVLISIAYNSGGQPFLRTEDAGESPVSFVEMQRRFDQWTKSADLKSEKGWKYYKRWEQEMLRHTDGKGNLVSPEVYMSEVLKATSEKSRSSVSRFSATAWSPSGPDIMPLNLTGYIEAGIGRINCMAFHPSDANTFFIGVAQGGVWKTTNGGQSWTPLTDDLPIIRISDICIDPVDPNTMYIAVGDFAYIGFGLQLNGRKRNTHYGIGIYKTTDGGVTWQPTGLTYQLPQADASLIKKILVNPNNRNELVACGATGMFTSSNGGTNWTQKSDSLFWDLVQDPANSNILYAASGWVQNSNTGSAGIYKSTDFGNTWTLLNTGITPRGEVQRIKLAIAPNDPACIYAIAVDISSGLFGIYKTINAGNSWQFIPGAVNILSWGDGTTPGGQGTYDLAALVNPTNKNIIYVGGINIWVSTDGAQNFDPVSHWTTFYGPTLHCDIHYIQRNPLNNAFYVCSDGGLYRTTNMIGQTWQDAQNGIPWPTQWTALNDGYQVTSFYRVSSSRNSTGRLIAGAQDNSSMYFDGTSWSTVFGGDGMDNYLDPNDDQMLVGSSQFGNYYVSYDNGFTASGWNTNPNGEPAEWTTPIVADYNNPGTFYVGNTDVYKSDDGGNNWSQISTLPQSFSQTEISALAVSNSNPNVLVAAKRVRYEYGVNGSIFRTSNGGNSWTDITPGVPDSLYYTSVDIHLTNANIIYVSMAGFVAGQKVYRSTNGGITWQNISFNLPNLPVNCVKNIPGTDDVMAATDIGVYVLDNDMNTWNLQSTNLPNVIVTDIEFNTALNRVYVCTFGRGIWEANLAQLVNISEPGRNQVKAQLYPSMNNGTFTIRVDNNNNEMYRLELVDIRGAVVYSTSFTGNETRVQTSLLPGKYFARIVNGTDVSVQTFVVN